MREHEPLWVSPQALFRYRIVSAVRGHRLVGRSLAEAVGLVARPLHYEASGQARRVSERSIYRWLRAYEKEGLAGLEDKQRQPLAGSRALTDELVDFVRQERERDATASLPELLRRARAQGVVRAGHRVNRSTLWRVCRRLGIPTRRRKQPHQGDMRRFAYRERMQMVLADFTHFRAGATRARRAALYLLDDATRFGLQVAVSTSEQADVFLHAVHQVLVRYGAFDALFTDGGSAFTGNDCARVFAQLGIALIIGTPGYPEGHGKVERFNQAVKGRLLRSLDGAPDVDPDCGALTLRLRHDLRQVYNHLPHEGLGKESPHQRWSRSQRPLRPVAGADWLRACFTISEQRRVSSDHVVSFAGTRYEVPRGHAGERIILHRRILEDDALYIHHHDRLLRLHPVDLYANALSGRGTCSNDDSPGPRSKTASTMRYEQAFAPILDADGGFADNTPHHRNQEMD
jgi:putative transposase